MDYRIFILIGSVLVSFGIAVLVAPFLIKKLRILKFGQQIITEYGPTWHKNKQGVPTMGGIIFIISTVLSYLLFILITYLVYGGDSVSVFSNYAFMCLVTSIILGLMGFSDDFIKIKKKHNQGLNEIQKLIIQTVVGIGFVVFISINNSWDTTIRIPFVNGRVDLWYFYYPLAVIAFVGFVNACNLTDGIDGLAASVTIPVMLFYSSYAFLIGSLEVSTLSGAFIGGLIGYLLFNWHPARVFMGDTGSMFIGGMVVTIAFALDIPFVLFIAGFVYFIEALSVMIQVAYFKLTHGKRLFKMTPIHHHFELCKWSEEKIVIVFTSVSVVMCILAIIWVLKG